MSVGPWSGASSAGPSGVRGAARAHSPVENRRGPSGWPVSGKDQAYKPVVKSLGGQQESEGAVVPLIGVRNSPGGKGPSFDHAREAGKCEGITGSARSNSPGGSRPWRSRRAVVPVGVKVRQLQRALWAAAKRSEGRRFRALSGPYRLICGCLVRPGRGGAVAAEGAYCEGDDEGFWRAESERDAGQQPDLGVGGFETKAVDPR